jgi:acetyl esterase/lipase
MFWSLWRRIVSFNNYIHFWICITCFLGSPAYSSGKPVQIQYCKGEIRQDTLIYKTLSDGYKLTAIVHYPREWRSTDRRPAFVCSYGSGWNGGKFEADPINEKHLSRWEPKCDDLALKGMVCIRYDYRSSQKIETFASKEIAMISDSRSVVRWIRRNAMKLGVDTNRICGAGGSSGFHIMASGTILEGGRYDQPGESPDVSPKANVLIGFTGALCKNANDINGLCPGYSITPESPPFLGIVGGNDNWRFGVQNYVDKSYKLHIPSLLKSAPGQGHDFHVGIFGRGTPAWYDSTMRWAQNFLFSIGHMNLTVECRPGDKIELNALSKYIRDYCSLVDTMENCEEILYTYTGKGGKVSMYGVFTSSGLPGLYKVKAYSANYPHIYRTAIVRVPVLLTVNAAASIKDLSGFYGIYVRIKNSSGEDAEISVRNSAKNKQIILPIKSLKQGFYYIGAFPFDKKSLTGIYVSGQGKDNIDSIMLIPAYPGIWKEEITQVTANPKQYKHIKSLLFQHDKVDVYSPAGKKLNPNFLKNRYHKKKRYRGVIIIRNRLNGKVRLIFQ